MKTIEFLKFLQSRLGGELDHKIIFGKSNVSFDVGIPRLLLDFQGEHIRFDLQASPELIIKVYHKPPHLLKIYHENFATKLLDKVHLHSEIKIGDPEFDDKYVIEFTKKEIAQKTIKSEFKDCIANLEPFKIFQMTKLDYTISKNININNSYDVDNAESDISNMIKIVKICEKILGN